MSTLPTPESARAGLVDLQIDCVGALRVMVLDMIETAKISESTADKARCVDSLAKITQPLAEQTKQVALPTLNFNFGAGFSVDITPPVEVIEMPAPEPAADATELFIEAHTPEHDPMADLNGLFSEMTE